jgi:hypothetical protein
VPGNTTGNAIASGYVGEVIPKTGSFGPMAAGTNSTQIYSTTISSGVYLVTGNINLTWSAAPSVSNFPLVTISGGVMTSESSRLPAKPALANCTDYFPVVGTFVSNGTNPFTLSGSNFSSGASLSFGIDLKFTRIA